MTACLKCGHDPSAAISATWQFHIPRAVTSGNRHVYNVGGSRWAYAKERDAWQSWFVQRASEEGITKATGRRRVTLTRFYGGRQREMDVDNMIAGLKPCLDAMTRSGLLVDDKREFAEVIYVQIQTSVAEQRGLFVTIEELV